MSLVTFGSRERAPFQVSFALNHTSGPDMVTGTDEAWSVEEAMALAQTRVQYSGIPGTAYVWQGPECLWKYWKDFDGKVFFSEKPEATPR